MLVQRTSVLLQGCSLVPLQQHCIKLLWPTLKQLQTPFFLTKYYYHGSLHKEPTVHPLDLSILKRSE